MSFCRVAACCGIALGVGAVLADPAEACNTPVYRYAMDNWAPAPFEVYYFYREKIAKEDEAVHRMLKDLARGGPVTANLALATIDVSKPRQLDPVPAPVKESWKSKHGGALPTYLVWSPWGAEVFAGRLDQDAVREMSDSPVRTRVAELLKQGNAAILLILAGAKESDTQRAQSVAKEVITRGASGKIPVAGTTTDFPETPDAKPQADGDQADHSNRLELAQLTLSRSDPKERWLIRMLTAVEPDLPQFADEPMIFGVYGRGRAMEPFVGKGITADNLTDLAAFLSGACSCQVKDRNPGADLLFHWDWNATADALAASDPAHPNTQLAYQEFAADAMSDRKPSDAKRDSSLAKAAPADSARAKAAKPSEPASKPGSRSTPSLVSDPPQKRASSQPSLQKNGPQEALGPLASQEKAAYDSGRAMWRYGVGFALVTMLVVVAGLVLLRRQTP